MLNSKKQIIGEIIMISSNLTYQEQETAYHAIVENQLIKIRDQYLSETERKIASAHRSLDSVEREYRLSFDAQGRKADAIGREADGLGRQIDSIRRTIELERAANQRYADSLQREVDSLDREYSRRGTTDTRKVEINSEKTTLRSKISQVRSNSNTEFSAKYLNATSQINDLQLQIQSKRDLATSVRQLAEKEGQALKSKYLNAKTSCEAEVSGLKAQLSNPTPFLESQTPHVVQTIKEKWDKIKILHLHINNCEFWLSLPELAIATLSYNNVQNLKSFDEIMAGMRVDF
ncbi:MAG: hypothetical protein ACRCXZ_05580, partial [Patescibacteria group bacterium]